MSMRGLVVALLCGLLGLGLGVVVAYAAQPPESQSDDAHPMSGSPSVPTNIPTNVPKTGTMEPNRAPPTKP